MITVTIKTILHLKKIFGPETVISLPAASSLADLLEVMADRWGEEFRRHICQPGTTLPLHHIRLLVNGRDIAFLDRLQTRMHESDEVLILPPVAGG